MGLQYFFFVLTSFFLPFLCVLLCHTKIINNHNFSITIFLLFPRYKKNKQTLLYSHMIFSFESAFDIVS